MAYARRYRFRRRPVRKIQRRRRRFRRRARRMGNLLCKLTRVVTIAVDPSKVQIQDLAVNPHDIQEYVNLGKQFEFCKFISCRVRVIPHQNVTNNSTSSLPNYCILPWHSATPPGSTGFTTYTSHDRAKVYRSTQKAHMNFVCSTAFESQIASKNASSFNTIKWKPDIRWDADKTLSPTIRTGILAFQGDADAPTGAKSKFTIFQDYICLFKNQCILETFAPPPTLEHMTL